MIHLDLFSGIGGFALATESVWPDVKHVFCEIDPFCQAILKKHWPNSKIYGDIRTLANSQGAGQLRKEQLEDRGESEQRSSPDDTKQENTIYERTTFTDSEHLGGLRPEAFGEHSLPQPEGETGKELPEPEPSGSGRIRPEGFGGQPFILTGGFPCQPFSQAGRRKGTADDRYLWPEMLRVIREFHPRWVIGENVGGLVTWSDGLVLEQVHTDLENEGYEVQAFIIPACALNAPHRRDRVWIVAHDISEGGQPTGGGYGEPGERKAGTYTSCSPTTQSLAHSKDAEREQPRDTRTGRTGFTDDDSHASDTASRETVVGDRGTLGFALRSREDWPDWTRDWREVAFATCDDSVDDGLPSGLARPRGWRNAALKACGNAIVPQVAIEIMRAIKVSDL